MNIKLSGALSSILMLLAASCGGSMAVSPANSVTPASARANAFVVYLGDSVFACYTVIVPNVCPSAPGFPFPGVQQGAGGNTMAAAGDIPGQISMEERFNRDVVVPCHRQSLPCIAIVEGGRNDLARLATRTETLQQLEAAAQHIMLQAQEAGVSVAMLTIPPYSAGVIENQKADMQSFNNWLVNTAIKPYVTGQCPSPCWLTWADVWSAMNDGSGNARPGLLFDGVHPSAQGFQSMDPVILSAISRLQPEKPAEPAPRFRDGPRRTAPLNR